MQHSPNLLIPALHQHDPPPGSRSSSTRAERRRSREERTRNKHRPRQPSLSAHGSTGNESDMGSSQE
eukprot:1150951-Pelagomonas_calceolata.AAC.1